jgi:hypothetical protein
MREARRNYRASMMIFTFIVVIPLLFQAVALGWSLLGNIAGVISFLVGMYKAAKKFGWIKKSQREIDDEERQRKMRHYFYHCERNPQGFARLKCENFDRENAEKNRLELDQLKAHQTTSNPSAPSQASTAADNFLDELMTGQAGGTNQRLR